MDMLRTLDYESVEKIVGETRVELDIKTENSPRLFSADSLDFLRKNQKILSLIKY